MSALLRSAATAIVVQAKELVLVALLPLQMVLILALPTYWT